MEKRILVFTNHFYPEYFKVNDIVSWLTECNHEVSVVTQNPNYPKGKIYKGYSVFGSKGDFKGASLYRLPIISRGNGKPIRLIANYLTYFISLSSFTFWLIFTHKKYDSLIIHHTSPPFLFLPSLFYKTFKGSKIILWDLDMWPHTLDAIGVIKSKIVLNIIEKLFKWFYKKFDLILLGSKSFIEIANKRVSSEKTVYFPNWAEPIFENTEEEITSPPKSDKIIISYTGNIGEAQNLENLVEAVSLCKRDKIEVRLIGDGRNKENLKKLVESKNLMGYIKFFEPVSSSELLKYFKESDYLFISLNNNPIFSKTVPAKLQTYMAVGKPIIANISGEAYTMLKEYKTGFQAKAGNEAELCAIFNHLEQITKKEYDTFAFNCKQLYKSRFTSNQRKKQLLSIIN